VVDQSLYISILFRIINAVILAALGAHLFKRYISPKLHQQYDEYKELLRSLKKEEKRLNKDYDTLQTLIENDSLLSSQLKKRIFAWKQAVETEEEKIASLRDSYIEATQRRANTQEKNLIIELANKEIMPIVLSKLHTTMADHFSEGKTQQRYLKKFLSELNKKTGRRHGSLS